MYSCPKAFSSLSKKTWMVIGSDLDCSVFLSWPTITQNNTTITITHHCLDCCVFLSTSWPTTIEPPLKNTPVLFNGRFTVSSAPELSSQEPGRRSTTVLFSHLVFSSSQSLRTRCPQENSIPGLKGPLSKLGKP